MAFDFPSSPLPNDVFTDTATGTSYTFSGVAWKRTGQTSATENYVEEAPNTGNPYSRQSAGWVPSTMGGGIPESPLDSKTYGRNSAAWVEIPPPLADAPANNAAFGRKNNAWVPVQETAIVSSDTPPASPTDNLIWFDTSSGTLFVYVNDGTSTQWVAASMDEAPVDGQKYVRSNAGWVLA